MVGFRSVDRGIGTALAIFVTVYFACADRSRYKRQIRDALQRQSQETVRKISIWIEDGGGYSYIFPQGGSVALPKKQVMFHNGNLHAVYGVNFSYMIEDRKVEIPLKSVPPTNEGREVPDGGKFFEILLEASQPKEEIRNKIGMGAISPLTGKEWEDFSKLIPTLDKNTDKISVFVKFLNEYDVLWEKDIDGNMKKL